VFFKKANMRDKRPWWLSTYYSFCIQSFVKRCLLALETNPSYVHACEEYLQVPINLFIASSNNYDPLKEDWSEPVLETSRCYIIDDLNKDDYAEAQIAVGQSKWEADGISGSSAYLKSLFSEPKEDDKTSLTRQEGASTDITSWAYFSPSAYSA